MKKVNQFYILYQLLDVHTNRDLIEDFVLKSVKSLESKGVEKHDAINQIKSYFVNLNNQIMDVCVDLLFKEEVKPVEKEERLLKVDEIAKILKITKAQVYNLINDGKIKSTKIGERGTRVLEKDFNDFFKGRNIR